MNIEYEFRSHSATLIFDLEDGYARELGHRGLHPRPIGPIRFFVVGQMIGGIRQNIEPKRELIIKKNPSGYYIFCNKIRFPDDRVRRDAFTEGIYAVRLESPFYQSSEREDIGLPKIEKPYFIDLLPGYAYPFPNYSTLPGGLGPTLLRGSLHQTDGAGIGRTTVHSSGQSNIYRTDSTGKWVLVFSDEQITGDVSVRFGLPDGSTEVVNNVTVKQGRELTLSQTAMRGRVLNPAGLGIDNAIIRVTGYAGSSLSKKDGSWTYFFPPSQQQDTINITAELADGQSLTQTNIQLRPRETVIIPIFQF